MATRFASFFSSPSVRVAASAALRSAAGEDESLLSESIDRQYCVCALHHPGTSHLFHAGSSASIRSAAVPALMRLAGITAPQRSPAFAPMAPAPPSFAASGICGMSATTSSVDGSSTTGEASEASAGEGTSVSGSTSANGEPLLSGNPLSCQGIPPCLLSEPFSLPTDMHVANPLEKCRRKRKL